MRLDCGISLQQEVGWDRQTLRMARYLADSRDESFLVYSESVLLEQISSWGRKFPTLQPVHEVGYNSLGRVLEGLSGHGVRLDVSAKHQIGTLDNLALLNQDADVVFSAPHKIGSHIKFAREKGIQNVVFNSREEIKKIVKNSPSARVWIQFDCSQTANLVEIKELIQISMESGLNLVGIYLEISTLEEELNQLLQWILVSRSILDWSRAQGAEINLVHLGELAGTSFSHGFVSDLNSALNQVFPAYLGIRLSATASKFLVSPTITLAARIVKLDDTKTELKNYFINEGVFGAFSGNLCIEGCVSTPYPLGGGKGRKGNRSQVYDTKIFGPSGDELDIILEDILLPELEKDDWLLFSGMGCLNNLEFINHSNVSGTRNFIYNKMEEVDECFDPAKPCSWEFNSCQSIEINLDNFEILNFA